LPELVKALPPPLRIVSLHDGMNLVAKEFVAARRFDGVLF
jgi:trehalose-6-phosphate synthase